MKKHESQLSNISRYVQVSLSRPFTLLFSVFHYWTFFHYRAIDWFVSYFWSIPKREPFQ